MRSSPCCARCGEGAYWARTVKGREPGCICDDPTPTLPSSCACHGEPPAKKDPSITLVLEKIVSV